MFLIKELIKGRRVFGVERIIGFKTVDWGKNGENIVEVPDDFGRKLIKFSGFGSVYREVKLPLKFEVPVEPVEAPVNPVAPQAEAPVNPVAPVAAKIIKPKRGRKKSK